MAPPNWGPEKKLRFETLIGLLDFVLLTNFQFYIVLVGLHSFAWDFYCQLSRCLSPLSFYLSPLSLSPSLFPDKKFPALDPSLGTFTFI
jgi:hypothetical protein